MNILIISLLAIWLGYTLDHLSKLKKKVQEYEIILSNNQEKLGKEVYKKVLKIKNK